MTTVLRSTKKRTYVPKTYHWFCFHIENECWTQLSVAFKSKDAAVKYMEGMAKTWPHKLLCVMRKEVV